MGDALDITIRRERGVVIAAVTGGVDIFTVALLRECLFELADRGRTLIVDLNRVTFIDSSGLGGAGRRGPPRRRARRQPACSLRPAANPQAVVADRGGPPDSAGGHRGRGADVPGGVPGRSRLVAPGQLACRGHRDAEQAPVQVRPSEVHHGRPRSRARYRGPIGPTSGGSRSIPPGQLPEWLRRTPRRRPLQPVNSNSAPKPEATCACRGREFCLWLMW